MNDDLVYLLRRAAEERIRASAATNERARTAHLGMADAYDAKLRGNAEAPAAGAATIRLRAIQT